MQGKRDALREEIVKRSIQILRSHGKGENEIKEMMLKDFSIGEDVLEHLLKSGPQS